jgi:hypothetical protein
MTNIAIENGPFIVDLPNLKMVIFNSYVSLPEGKSMIDDKVIYINDTSRNLLFS